MDRHEPTFDGANSPWTNGPSTDMTVDDLLAKLVTMRAAGEISGDELRAARLRLTGQSEVLVDQPDLSAERHEHEEKFFVEPAPQNRKGAKPKKGKGNALAIIGVVIVGLFGMSWYGSSQSSTTGQSSSQTTTPARTAQQTEDQRKGFHCLSSWDGSNRDLVNAVKNAMRDPGSFEHISTRITPVNASGQHTLFMDYRGRNGFGGMSVETATGTLSNSGCRLTSVGSL